MKEKIKEFNQAGTGGKLIEKIVLNAGVGRSSGQPGFEEKLLAQITRDLGLITGQKPQIRQARKSIAGFKLRQGQTVGLRVTLRRKKMIDFFERLIRIVLPRVRDFSGLSLTTIDDHGVLNIGIKEHTVFPEVDAEKSPVTFSLGINIVPKIKDRSKTIDIYRGLGVPLKKNKN